MSFRGPLLKPSEKNGNRVVRSSQRVAKQSRYEVLKEKIRTWWEDRLKIGEALREIQSSKLYKGEYETFEEFCEEEFNLKRAQAYRLIEASEIKESLSPMGDKIVNKITNERQARALAPVPVENREEVIEKAAETGKVTAKTITEAAKEVVKPAPKAEPKAEEEATKTKHFDKTGYPIPDAILADWQAAESFKATLNQLHAIKIQVEKAVEKSELVYAEIGQDTVADLKNAWTTLKQVLPYAVCPSCQGRTRSKCTACKRRGFVSEFGYKHWFASEVIELREKAINK